MSHDVHPDAVAELARRAKMVLRKRMRGVRGTIPRGAIAQRSAAIVERLAAHPWLAGATIVASFWPIEGRNEVDLGALDPVLRARGVRVAYPAIDPETNEMTFRDPGDPSTMEEAGKGFREPGPDAPTVRPDVVLTPCLLVDPRGHRLGYGAGYYDRTLPGLCPPGRAIVIAFDFQVVADVPTSPTDVAGAAIVTDTRAFEAEA